MQNGTELLCVENYIAIASYLGQSVCYANDAVPMFLACLEYGNHRSIVVATMAISSAM